MNLSDQIERRAARMARSSERYARIARDRAKAKPSIDSMRPAIYAKSNGLCWYCGRRLDPKEWHPDHVIPLASGGLNDIDNLVPTCKGCNLSKGGRSLDNFRWNRRKAQVAWAERFTSTQLMELDALGVPLPIPPHRPLWRDIQRWLDNPTPPVVIQ